MNQTNGATYDTEWCNTRFETNRATRTDSAALTDQSEYMISGSKVIFNKKIIISKLKLASLTKNLISVSRWAFKNNSKQ